jgi:hypothetical protein
MTDNQSEFWGFVFVGSVVDGVPVECRIRSLLKHAKRTLKLRCTRVVDPQKKDIADLIDPVRLSS